MSEGWSFGQHLSEAFSVHSKAAGFSEVQQFRALIKSFRELKSRFRVEEYHGPKHQVYFNGHGAWGRTPARCELCDLVIITYSLAGGFNARLTFLQAKLSRENHLDLCSSMGGTPRASFKANLEQWDLLSRRPDVLPVPPFIVHPKILSGALLPSIGSFGVFHKTITKNVDFFYAAADALSVAGTPSSKHGRLVTNLGSRHRLTNGCHETTFCCCLPLFGRALYDLEIGTPIQISSSNPVLISGTAVVQTWVKKLLSLYIRTANSNSVIAREILEQLENSDIDEVVMDRFDALPSLVLIRSESNSSPMHHESRSDSSDF